MMTQGAEVVKHYKDLAFMGFIEVVMNLRTIIGNMKWCKEDILQYQQLTASDTSHIPTMNPFKCSSANQVP